MVISPKELIKTREERTISAVLEKRIDSYLEQNFTGEPIELPNFSEARQLRDIVLKDLLDSYREQGWTISKDLNFSYPHSKYLGSYHDFHQRDSVNNTIKLYG